MKIVAVHDGTFHADDVFSVAILRLLYPKLKVIRTRDPKLLHSKAEMRIDVGRKYDYKGGDFDHHQIGGAGERRNHVPYASVGLIWKHFGRRLASPKAWGIIDRKIIQDIDAMDNGMKLYRPEIGEPYDIGEIIAAFNCDWQDKTDRSDERFEEAVGFAMLLMKREIALAEGTVDAEVKVSKLIVSAKIRKEKYILLEKYMPWEGAVVEKSDLLYVIYPDRDGKSWCLKAVPESVGSFECRKLMPRKWAGLNHKDLANVTGVSDAVFCHKSRFIASAKSRSGAIELTRLAIKY